MDLLLAEQRVGCVGSGKPQGLGPFERCRVTAGPAGTSAARLPAGEVATKNLLGAAQTSDEARLTARLLLLRKTNFVHKAERQLCTLLFMSCVF